MDFTNILMVSMFTFTVSTSTLEAFTSTLTASTRNLTASTLSRPLQALSRPLYSSHGLCDHSHGLNKHSHSEGFGKEIPSVFSLPQNSSEQNSVRFLFLETEGIPTENSLFPSVWLFRGIFFFWVIGNRNESDESDCEQG
jgi:hypothetical protein